MRKERSETKQAIAADAWRLMLDSSKARFERASGIVQKLGLTPGHVKALIMLDPDQPGPMGSMASAFGCDASTVTWLVDRLEERGLVERRMLASDRRVKTVVLTPRGVKTRAELLKRLYEPPAALLGLDRTTLETVRDALARLPVPMAGLPREETA